MKQYFRYLLFSRMIFSGALVTFLSGCAFAPGMYFDSRYSKDESAKAEATVAPDIKAITPQLINQERQQAESEVPSDLSAIMLPPKPYLIGPGDQLSIIVWDHPELTMQSTGMAITTSTATSMLGAGASPSGSGYAVSNEGRIQFPYSGDLKVEGLTEVQARDLLVQQLSKLIKKPEVTLRVLNYRSKHIYVDGEVKQPGSIQMDDIPLSLPEALSRAGGITSLGDQSRISLTRAGKVYWINLPKLIKKANDPAQIMMSSGDLLSVRPMLENKIYVIGEVVKPTFVTLVNGHLSLNEALGEAGGVNPQSGDGHQVYVIRNGADSQPIVYHLDAHSPVMLALAENFEMKPKDVVFVDAAFGVRLSRIVSLILPSAQAITIANRGFQ